MNTVSLRLEDRIRKAVHHLCHTIYIKLMLRMIHRPIYTQRPDIQAETARAPAHLAPSGLLAPGTDGSCETRSQEAARDVPASSKTCSVLLVTFRCVASPFHAPSAASILFYFLFIAFSALPQYLLFQSAFELLRELTSEPATTSASLGLPLLGGHVCDSRPWARSSGKIRTSGQVQRRRPRWVVVHQRSTPRLKRPRLEMTESRDGCGKTRRRSHGQ